MRQNHRMKSVSSTCLGTLLLASILAPDVSRAVQPTAVATFADEKTLRELMKLKLEFDAFVFDAAAFPACDFDKPASAKNLLGAYKIKTTFYDREFQQAA